MPETDKPKLPEQPVEQPKDVLSETQHSVTIHGEVIQYTVTTGTMVLKEEMEKEGTPGLSDGEQPKAKIFFVAYTRNDVPDRARRPLTFSFNGGPGSSSVWLHLGVLGPRRVLMDEQGGPLPPPHRLVENEFSLLDVTDLVFIDPVSTGYSRVLEGKKPKEYHGFKKDIESVGDFIRLYTTRYQRWQSPKYLIGESYGTTRAAGLSGYLQERHGLYLNGIMLVSCALDFATLEFLPGHDLPYILHLPTYAATAWYHRRLAPELQADLHATLAEVEAFAAGEYTLALMKGDALTAEETQQIAARLARYTGLSVDYVLRSNLRIEIMRFCKELLREQRRTVGRLDTRFLGMDRDAAGEFFEHDPSMSNIMGPYTGAFYEYVRRDLKFESDLPYEILSERVHPWSYTEHENRFVYVGETLRKAMSMNPYLRVYVANGYFDLATPYFATRYVFNHMALDPSLRGSIQSSDFEAGHMMYIHLPSLAKMKQELAAFILNQ